MVTAANSKLFAVGQVGELIRRDGQHLAGKIAVNDATTIAKMDDGEAELSCGYECDLVMGAGVSPQGETYHATQTNILYNHVARVPAGRAETARARMDAMIKRVARADAAMQVPTQNVAVTALNPEGVCAYVRSSTMTSSDLYTKVARALANMPHISVAAGDAGQLVRMDERVIRVDSNAVSIDPAFWVSVKVASKTMTADQLTSTLSAALSASSDFFLRTDSRTQEKARMDLTQALAALAAANEKIGGLTAEVATQTRRADAADTKIKETEKQLVTAEASSATEKLRADTAEKKATDADKARTDASANFDARVSARSNLIAIAIGALGRNDSGEVLSVDGKTTVKLDAMNDRDIRVVVVQKLDGVVIPKERSDDAVGYAFDLATDRAAKSGQALGAARETLVAHNLDGRAQTGAPVDREDAARQKMMTASKNAWKFDHKTGGSVTVAPDVQE
jgi:hypothetical protein